MSSTLSGVERAQLALRGGLDLTHHWAHGHFRRPHSGVLCIHCRIVWCQSCATGRCRVAECLAPCTAAPKLAVWEIRECLWCGVPFASCYADQMTCTPQHAQYASRKRKKLGPEWVKLRALLADVDPLGKRRLSCETKDGKYLSQAEAENAAQAVVRHLGFRLYPYRCPVVLEEHWHLTSNPQPDYVTTVGSLLTAEQVARLKGLAS